MEIEEKLWEYIDGVSTESERALISKLLHSDEEWRLKYNELIAIHQLMHSVELEMPSMRFSQNVMEEITKFHIAPATKSYINKKVIYGIGGFFITMILGLLIYSFAQINWNAENDNLLSNQITGLNWSHVFNTTYFKIFMMINVVLGLMLLDQYLEGKKQAIKGRKA